MARAVVEEFPFLKDEEGQGFVCVIASKIMIKCPTYIHVELLTLYKTIVLGFQGFFQGFFRAVKRPQKLNLKLSFETQSSHQSFSAVKMKLFELNFVRVEISFQLEAQQLRKNGWNSSHNTRKIMHSPSLTSL